MSGKLSIKKLPIRWKLKVIILTVATLLSVIAGVAIISYQHNMLRNMLVSDLYTETEITAYNTAAALSFFDKDAAEESLSALTNDPSVAMAALYDKGGQFFAGYVREGIHTEIPLKSDWNGTAITDIFLIVSIPVILDEEQIGSISVAANLSELRQTSLRSAVAVVIVMIISLVVAGLISVKLEQLISKPVINISKTAQKISRSRDYSLRAEKRSEDELGMLADAFNDMLNQIEARDEQLQKHKSHLEKVVGERTGDLKTANIKLRRELKERKKIENELRQAKKEAEDATLLKDKFLSLISHDLRSPLQGMISYLDMICDTEKYNVNGEKREEMIGMVKSTVEGMTEMVTRLLEVSRLQTNRMRPSRKIVKVSDLVDRHMANLKHLATKKGIEMSNELPSKVIIAADPDLFGEVIHNLLSNAVKFCGRGDRINVFVPEGKNGNTTIAVKDTGYGINSLFLENLFRQEIKTSSSGSAGEQGSGLGLPLCMDIMKAHGGGIDVESVPEQGSTFYLEIPPLESFIILADDQEVWRSTIQEHLSKQFELTIIEANDGLEVLDILYDAKPELILTDIDMPGINGLQLIKTLKEEEPEYKNIPIIAFSALTCINTAEDWETDVKSKALSLGADYFLSKPIVKKSLLAVVKKCLKKTKRQSRSKSTASPAKGS